MSPPPAGRLATTQIGDGPVLTLLHGFSQTSRCWGPFLDRLAERHRCTLVDAPGHGASGDVRADLWRSGELVLEAAEGSVLLGYSMGARIALHAALLDASTGGADRAGSPRLRGLVLVSGTAGIDDPAERRRRREADEQLAERIERIGVERFVDEWLDLPMFQDLPPAVRFTAERSTGSADGLASSLRLAGTGTQEPLWDRLGDLRLPTLVLTGERDEKFTQLGERMTAALSDARHVVVPGVGHSVHLEAPDAAAEAVLAFTAALG